MNLSLLSRAIHRHKYMQDRPAYREFLEQIDSVDDVWKSTQHEIASWWKMRQGASITMEIKEPGLLDLSCDLEGSVLEIDGERLAVPPARIPVSDLPAGKIGLKCSIGDRYTGFLREILGHLGYGHITLAVPGEESDADEDEILPILSRLHEMSVIHQKYSRDDIEDFRSMLAGIHHRRKIPDLRIWPLPHRDGVPYRVGVSTRYDVDKAIINLPGICDLESRHGMKSTAYLRPRGYFYGEKEIRKYIEGKEDQEIALHGEFISTARNYSEDESEAAVREKKLLEDISGSEVFGICMHGGELRTNSSENTYDASEKAGFEYNTFYRNSYFHPLHVARDWKIGKMLSIGQHYADITVKPGPGFSAELLRSFLEKFDEARKSGGIFVLVLHPLYFDFRSYLADPGNLFRLMKFFPGYLIELGKMRRDQPYYNS